MQWVDGVLLSDLINCLYNSDRLGLISSTCVLQWMKTLVEAIIYCEYRGIHHLDLKPKNLVLTPVFDGATKEDLVAELVKEGDISSLTDAEIKQWCECQELKILDFGLAKRSTKSGAISTSAGTPKWMAPEQVCEQLVDAALIDQYGIGAVTYACLTGQSPNVPDAEVFENARENDDASDFCSRERPGKINPTVSRDLDAIVMKCLQVDSADRYQTLDELREDILRCQSLRPISARIIGSDERLLKYVLRHPWAVGTLILLATALTVTAWSLLSLASANREAMKARESDQKYVSTSS